MDEAVVPAQLSDAGRIEALEHEVRLLASRLAGWVEAQLLQSLDDRRQDMKALRSELLFMVNEQLAAAQPPAPGEALEQRVRDAMSRLSDSVEARLAQEADDRRAAMAAQASKAEASAAAALATVQDVAANTSTLGARLDEVAAQAAAAAKASAASRAEADALPGRMEAFEQRVKAAMGRLTDSVETRLAETAAGRDPAVDELRASLRAGTGRTEAVEQQVQALRAELEADRASLRERLDALAAQVTSATDTMAALQAEADAAPKRAELLEQRVRSAVSRLAESVDSRLGETKAEVETAVAALRAGSTLAQERMDSIEELHRDAGDRFAQMVETKLAEVVDGRRVEFDQLRHELEEQLRQGRNEIGTAVADAHRRFVVSVDKLEEQMHLVTGQAAAADAAVAGVALLPETVASDGRRIEALEVHTRRTDARLGELVDAKLAELAAQRLADVDAVRHELRTALDAHLAEIRAEVATSLGESRVEAAAGATRFEERLAIFDALEDRIEQALQARLSALDAAAAEIGTSRAELARAQEKVEDRVEGLAQQVDVLVKAASTEGGVLAPVRSDLRLLQAHVAELADTVAGLPRRKVAAPAAKAAPIKKPPAKKLPAKKAAVARTLPAKTLPAKKAVARKVPAAPGKAAARRRLQ